MNTSHNVYLQEGRQCTYHVTLRRVHLTTFVVDKQ